MIKKMFFILFVVSLFTYPVISQEKDKEEDKSPYKSATFSGLKFRSIGPAVTSGRVVDFAVNPNNFHEYYAAVACGNVWKTTTSGTTWEPIFDNYGSFSIGCVTIDPKNSHVVYVGTGENNSQRSVSWGDGLYRSEDGGKSFKNIGLKKSEHIAKILIDPRDSKVLYVAAQGPLWGPGGDRGLYKSTDYGATWDSVLYISKNTGVTDVVMDPRDPDVLYAASYQRRRHVWTLLNGGPEGAIHKSTDGGKTWNKLESGLPKGDVGRIGLAISPVNPDFIYAIIEAQGKSGGFFRSTNRGAIWEKMNEVVSSSAQYYSEIFCDPVDVNKVYLLDTFSQITTDGGKTFAPISTKGRHVDDHAFWINPNNVKHFLIGGDGGIYETFDGGLSFHFKDNLPITQFYRVSVDNHEPFYRVMGGTQDNNSMIVPSQTINEEGIVNADYIPLVGGDGYEALTDPDIPNIIYCQWQYGGLTRHDLKSGETLSIKPQEGKGETPYRWNWDTPLILSPHANRLYAASNKVFRSDDKGNTWEVISPDLTRQVDRNKLEIMDRVWSVDAVAKNASTSFYGNIVSLTESPLLEGLIYAGTDDGLVQVTEDGGKNWKKIESFPDIPEMTYVSCLYASRFDANTVYATFDNHKRADFKPYVLVSKNRGSSWESISGDLKEPFVIYAITQDHIKPDLLFIGTEYGVFFTMNGGKKWIQLKGNLPTQAVRDLDIQERENDLALATFGRGFYILDNYSPLRDLDEQTLEQENYKLFPVKDALMFVKRSTTFSSLGSSFFKADNPAFGATFTYYIKEAPKTKKETRQEKEKELVKDNKPVEYPAWDDLRSEDSEEKSYLLFVVSDEQGNVVRKLKEGIKQGINRITWDLRYADTNARLTLACAAAGDRAKAQAFLDSEGIACPIVPLSEFPSRADIAVECAPAAMIEDICRPMLEAGKSVMVLSCGALLPRPQLLDLAKAKGGRILVPSGALLGLDAVIAAAEGEITSVQMTTRKPPAGLKGAPYLEQHGISVDGLTQAKRVFSGSAREAAAGFPANVNVAAALSLAGMGPDRTRIDIWADPAVTRNCHEIEVEADSARFRMSIENVPSENPKTGRIVALSVLAALRKLGAPLSVGT